MLDVVATATVGNGVALRLEVTNAGDGPVSQIAPEVVYQGHEVRGTSVPDLPAGARHTWNLDLPAPAEPGTVPAVILVHYRDTARRRAEVPAVAAVTTPGLVPVPEVRATLTTSPVTG